jgi:hypothetical protein
MLQSVLRSPDVVARLSPEDYRGLTPLIYLHINPYGHVIGKIMSSQLLAECMEHFETDGFEPAFQSYFMRLKSQLLASGDVACGLVFLTTQEDARANSAYQVLGLLLDEARMGLENDSEYAGDFLETIEMAVQAGAVAGAIQPESIIEFAGLYRKVGLPVPQSLMIDPDNMPSPADMGGFDLSQNLEGLARDIMAEGGSAFDLFSAIDTMLAAVPEEIQASLANHIATMDDPCFERCALFMLLSGSGLVQEATIAGLFKRLDGSALNAETMTLLPMIRGWFTTGSTQAGLDEVIRAARKKVSPGQSILVDLHIKEILASVTDGVGAQNISIVLSHGSKDMLAMILIKAGHGVKDGFLVPAETNDDVERIIDQLRAEASADDISEDTLRTLLEGALADGLENNSLPPPGFLDVVEACNLFDLRPQKIDLVSLLDLADPERKIQDASAQALGRWIKDDIGLNYLEHLSDSWFEDTEETREILASTRMARRTGRSTENKIWKFLEARRDIWARRFLQTAVMLRNDDRLREWKTLTASAHGLMTGRALKRIPLMEDIMYTTIEAGDAKVW